MAETQKQNERLVKEALAQKRAESASMFSAETMVPDRVQFEQFAAGLSELTQKEKAVFQCYVDGLRTAEILEQLQIKENTLKFHNKHLYSKLGVSSRKQLMAVYKYYAAMQSHTL